MWPRAFKKNIPTGQGLHFICSVLFLWITYAWKSSKNIFFVTYMGRGKLGVHHIFVNCWKRRWESPLVTQQNHCKPGWENNKCWEWVGEEESVEKSWKTWKLAKSKQMVLDIPFLERHTDWDMLMQNLENVWSCIFVLLKKLANFRNMSQHKS